MTYPHALPAEVQNIPDFWDRLHAACMSFLVLDYDGTIAPFRAERMEALPLPGIARLLEKIREKAQGALAIMSGRPVSEILCLLGDLRIMTVGGHGSEFRFPDGTMIAIDPTGTQKQGLEQAWRSIVREAGEDRVERKKMSLALHTRGLDKDEAVRLETLAREKWDITGSGHELEIVKFNGGIELRCRGINKGDALLRLLSHIGGNAFTVYIGDDETDEDAFSAIEGHGVSIRVAESGNGTRAQGLLRDVHAVKDFLGAWLVHAPAGRHGETLWKREDWR